MALGVLLWMGCGGLDQEPPPTGEVARPSDRPADAPEASEPPDAAIPFFNKPERVPREPEPEDWFEEVTEQLGIDFTYRDGQEAGFYQLLENLGGGVAIFDYDQDGKMDLFFTGGGRLTGPPIQVHGRPSVLYRNEGDGRFRDVTEEAGVAGGDLYTHGVTVGDFDRDGWPDLFVAGFQGAQLLRNNQQGGFEDVTEQAGLHIDRWAVTGAWVDINNNGWLDLYVITYCDWEPDHRRRCLNDQQFRDICGPSLFPGARDYLFRNRGDGTFEDITDQAGLEPRARALGVVVADFDRSGWMDIYVANDVQDNHLYRCGPDLPLESVGLMAGIAYSEDGEREGSMGVDIGDFDGDGQIDLFYTNYANQDNSLRRNVGQPGEPGFLGVSSVTGKFGVSRPWVGFGTAFADFNSNGWLDLFVANGHVAYERLDSPYYQPAQMFRNEGGQRFVEVSEEVAPYFTVPHVGRGAAIGDLFNDGGMDLVIVHQNDPVVVLRNRQPPEHWVRVLLRGVDSNPDGIGAEVSAEFGERRLHFWVRGGGGYLSYFDPRIVFPAVDDQPVDVTVTWPLGRTEVFPGLTQGQTHELVEGMGRQP